MNRAMKDSGIPWIGEIPEGWDINLTSALFFEHKEKNTKLKEKNLLSLSFGNIIRKDINSAEGLLPASFESYNVIQRDDIVFRLTDLQNDKKSLRTGLCKENGIITSAYITIRAKSFVNAMYYHYLYYIYDTCKVFYGLGDGVRQSMNFNDLRKLLILLPPLFEQQKIADYLDRKCSEIDKMIALEEKVIEELKAYKQSVITEAVTKGLNPDVPMKDSGIEWIGEIPEVWSVLPFKACYRMFKGLNITKDNLTSTGHPVISYGQIHSKQNIGTGINCNLLKFISEDYLSKNPNCLSKEFDLFLADTSEDREGVGNAVFIDTDKPIFAGYHTIIARPLTVTKSKYFAYQLQTDAWRFQLRKEVSGIKVFSISQKLLNKTFIIIPTSKEQKAIADYLDHKCSEIDSLINIKLSKIDSLKDYKKSIIYEYVTGKREVQ